MLLNAIGWFLCGVLLMNTLPHLLHGISGNRFPSPFDKPHGKALSSPTKNVIWAFINFSLLLVILHFNRHTFSELFALVMLVGAFVMAMFLSRYFVGRDRE